MAEPAFAFVQLWQRVECTALPCGGVGAGSSARWKGCAARKPLAALVSLYDGEFLDGRDAARDQAGWTWDVLGARLVPRWPGRSKSAADWQRKLAAGLKLCEHAAPDAANCVAGKIQKNSSDQCFYVFNP